jgi:hypothetical protein
MPPCWTPATLTAQAYSGRLSVTISGTQEVTPGNSNQDAFYGLMVGNLSVTIGPDQDAVRFAPENHGNCTCLHECQPNVRLADFIVGPYPAFNPAHTYTVGVDLSGYLLSGPTRLYFGSW